MDVSTLLRRRSAWLPIAMSLAAMALVVWFVATYGVVRGRHDEGAPARIFQILLMAEVPIVVYFAVTWLSRAPRPATVVLVIQLLMALAAIALVVALEG
jgi:hypothetical protein